MNGVILIGIVIVTLLMVVVLLSKVLQVKLIPAVQRVWTDDEGPRGLLASCADKPCGPGLACNPNNKICHRQAGEVCHSYGECLPGQYCAGVCLAVADTTGGLNQTCPCASGYTCVIGHNSELVCRAALGKSVNVSSECASLAVKSGVCVAGLNGTHCRRNRDCQSNYCDEKNFCQTPGLSTGSVGAGCGNCLNYRGAPCVNSVCACSSGQPGVCITQNKELLQSCSYLQGCNGLFNCLNETGKLCTSIDGNCTCHFPFPDPNANNVCIPGMTLWQEGTCSNNNNVVCSVNEDCRNRNCSGAGVVNRYSVGASLGSSEQQIAIDSSWYLPAGVTRVDKVFALPLVAVADIPSADGTLERSGENRVDMVYLLSDRGLHCANFTSAQSAGDLDWQELLLPEVATANGTLALVTAASNGEIFLLALRDSSDRSVLYSMNARREIEPFNSIGGSVPGLQMLKNTNVALTIEELDVSFTNDADLGGDILIRSSGSYYLKKYAEYFYAVSFDRDNVDKVVFYYDVVENFDPAVVASCNNSAATASIQCPSYANQLVLPRGLLKGYLLGNALGTTIPGNLFSDSYNYKVVDISVYSPPQIGLRDARSLLLTEIYDKQNKLLSTVIIYSLVNQAVLLPLQVSREVKLLSCSTGLYVFAAHSCN